MNVLMLGWELPPHNSGGLGVACFQMCKALAYRGVNIEFVVPYNDVHDNINFMKVTPAIPRSAAEVHASGIAYDSFRYIYKNGQYKYVDLFSQVEKYTENIDEIVNNNEFDVIHAHDWLTFRAGIRAKELTGKPLVVHVHATEFDRAGGSKGNPLVHEIEYMGLMLADKIYAVSQFTKDIIVKEYHIPADKIEVMHNSIDAEEFEYDNDENAYKYLSALKQQGYKVVVNIGRLTVQKGLTNLLFAAKEVISRDPKVLFLIVGSGEQYNELLRLAANLGISKNIILTNFQRGKRWRDAYTIADLFVMPSISEPFGLTPLEAIGYGTPVLVSKQSGVSEILTNALKVDFWDVNEMANMIYSAVTYNGLNEELKNNSLNEYSNMSWDNTAAKLIDSYQVHKSKNIGGSE